MFETEVRSLGGVTPSSIMWVNSAYKITVVGPCRLRSKKSTQTHIVGHQLSDTCHPVNDFE